MTPSNGEKRIVSTSRRGVPARREDPGRLERVPGAVDAGPRVVRLQFAIRPRRLEVPEEQLALAVSRRDELAVGRERDAAGVARVQVALERPFPLLLDPFLPAVYVTIELSMDWPHQNCCVGCFRTMGTECMCGSLMYFVGTGMLYSQTKIFLSSPVEMNDFPSSMNVIELHGARWWL